jgi:hypothetical protein
MFLAVRSRSLPYGASNPHGERDEASLGRDEGARAGTNTLSQTSINYFLDSNCTFNQHSYTQCRRKHAVLYLTLQSQYESRYALRIHNAYSQSL